MTCERIQVLSTYIVENWSILPVLSSVRWCIGDTLRKLRLALLLRLFYFLNGIYSEQQPQHNKILVFPLKVQRVRQSNHQHRMFNLKKESRPREKESKEKAPPLLFGERGVSLTDSSYFTAPFTRKAHRANS